jgi:hypothetical protein
MKVPFAKNVQTMFKVYRKLESLGNRFRGLDTPVFQLK